MSRLLTLKPWYHFHFKRASSLSPPYFFSGYSRSHSKTTEIAPLVWSPCWYVQFNFVSLTHKHTETKKQKNKKTKWGVSLMWWLRLGGIFFRWWRRGGWRWWVHIMCHVCVWVGQMIRMGEEYTIRSFSGLWLLGWLEFWKSGSHVSSHACTPPGPHSLTLVSQSHNNIKNLI